MAPVPAAPSDAAETTATGGLEAVPGGALPGRRESFAVHLENFDGPFDLLLGLISKHKLDVTEIALAKVTDDFVAWIKAKGSEWDLDEASEFLVVAATLLDLKAARLLQYRAFKERGLYGEHDEVARGHDVGVARRDGDPEALRELIAARGDRVRRAHSRSGDAGGREPGDERLRHCAAADEADAKLRERSLHHASLGPNRAVPTRTSVAPSSIATSKSADIPIESSRRPAPPGRSRSASRSARSRANAGRVASGSSETSGTVMRPATRRCPSGAQAASSAGTSRRSPSSSSTTSAISPICCPSRRWTRC